MRVCFEEFWLKKNVVGFFMVLSYVCSVVSGIFAHVCVCARMCAYMRACVCVHVYVFAHKGKRHDTLVTRRLLSPPGFEWRERVLRIGFHNTGGV